MRCLPGPRQAHIRKCSSGQAVKDKGDKFHFQLTRDSRGELTLIFWHLWVDVEQEGCNGLALPALGRLLCVWLRIQTQVQLTILAVQTGHNSSRSSEGPARLYDELCFPGAHRKDLIDSSVPGTPPPPHPHRLTIVKGNVMNPTHGSHFE